MAINTTPNLHLPQWTPNEKPSYLVDFNQAFAAIDTGFSNVKEGSDGAVQTATAALAQASSALQTANHAQAAYNQLNEDLKPSTIPLTISPTSKATDAVGTINYNAATATLYVAITVAPGEHQANELLAVITLPANLEFQDTRVRIMTNRNNSGWSAFFNIDRQTNGTYNVAINQELGTTTTQVLIVGSAAFPAHYVRSTKRGSRVLQIATH